MRILVTGSRDWEDPVAISRAIYDACGGNTIGLVIVHGHCPTGADRFADSLAWGLSIQPERHPANWSGPCRDQCPLGHRRSRRGYAGATYCPMAGHYRNQEMVDLGADVVLAFQRNNSRGTQDCIDRARTAGLRVEVVTS